MNSLIKYPGSKWRIAKWIIEMFPPHHSYLEPFFGSGAVLFSKARSDIETINDLDGEIVNLFEWCRKDPECLAREIYLTPYARAVYDASFLPATDSFQQAVNFLVRLNMGHGFRANVKVGWKNDVQGRERAYAAQDWINLPDKIFQIAERLRGVQIECKPAIELIRRFHYSNVLIYCDPPYVLSARRGKQYRYEMDEKDHVELLCVLQQHPGPVLISGYDTDLYSRLLQGWHKETIKSINQLAIQRTECLWMNFEPARQQKLFKEVIME